MAAISISHVIRYLLALETKNTADWSHEQLDVTPIGNAGLFKAVHWRKIVPPGSIASHSSKDRQGLEQGSAVSRIVSWTHVPVFTAFA
jgi:hypothetical protein